MTSTSPKIRPRRSPSRFLRVFNRQRRIPVDCSYVAQVGLYAAGALRSGEAEVAVVLISDRAMMRLNRDFRGRSGTTDVLSFCGSGIPDHLGDIFISVETATRNAFEAGHGLRRELGFLVLHGMLHLAGYDHETDHGEMRRMERRLRRHPLFAE